MLLMPLHRGYGKEFGATESSLFSVQGPAKIEHLGYALVPMWEVLGKPSTHLKG